MKSIILNKKGQSVIEYIMLLAVVGTMIMTVMNSPLIKDTLGENSSFFAGLRNYLESTYQFGSYSADRNQDYSGRAGVHDTYARSAGESRFWGVTSADK